jgi:hypothetical protein
VKVKLNVLPGTRFFEFQAPLSAVTVCIVVSLFFQVTLEPTETVSDAGLKEKLTILTLEALPLGVVAVGVGLLLVGVLAGVFVLVGVLVTVFVVAVGLVDPPAAVVPPQAARKASRVRMSRKNAAVLKQIDIFFGMGLAFLMYMMRQCWWSGRVLLCHSLSQAHCISL